MQTSNPVREEIEDLAERLALLSDAQWNSPSLCEAWRVRDVVAHVTAGEGGAYGVRAVLAGLARYRLDYNRWMEVDGRARGEQDTAGILRELRDTATKQSDRRVSNRALTHVLIHGQDVCRPLGIRREIPDSHLIPVANFVAKSLIFRASKRIAGLRLIATDMPWSHGDGPEVTGPAEALVMTMAGRTTALGDLSGEGLTTLTWAFAR